MPQQFTAYLSFDGTCTEAMRFYEKVLNGKLEALITNGQAHTDSELPAGNTDRIMHAYLTFEGGALMAGDSVVGWPYEGMKGFHLAIQYEDTAAAQRVFEALADGGRTEMPWAATFWAEGFGMCVDRYGTPWMVNGKALNMNM